MLDGLLYFILGSTGFLIVLSGLVFFHEYGHYKMARIFGVKVETFSIGFGKALKSWTDKHGTRWQISAIPLGGYVKFLGDAGAASNPDSEQLEQIKAELEAKHGEGSADGCFHFKPLWQRALVVLAGPVANFILAIVLFAILAMTFGVQQPPEDGRGVRVAAVTESWAADEAGIEVGDNILEINGSTILYARDVSKIVTLSTGETLNILIDRNGETLELTAVPRREESRDAIGGKVNMGMLGVSLEGQRNFKRYNPVDATAYGAYETWDTLAVTGKYLGRLVTGKEDGKQLGSIVKIATVTSKATVDAASIDVSLGQRIQSVLFTLLSLGAALSVALGFANLLPIPVLDGGHLLFYGYEAVAGRPLSEKKQEFGFRLGLMLILMAFVFLTINDIPYAISVFSGQ